ncbi:hypothetical protein DIURU_002645 [Diutina rugosa]|uniref:Uncharacterized protein n=1 Tax=Diutina rugosa TaxID=5481 RepID=A0A642UP92_DIURU|nr:uncharacterized protein DIURU_002645 [Diutina rugosa]KAA8902749.1 hypothetical protein DIURU_002645 [Diutina rugosa]
MIKTWASLTWLLASVATVAAYQVALAPDFGGHCVYISGSDHSFIQVNRAGQKGPFAAVVFRQDFADQLGLDYNQYMLDYAAGNVEQYLGPAGKFKYTTESDQFAPTFNDIITSDVNNVEIPITESSHWCVFVGPLDGGLEVKVRNPWGYLAAWEYQSIPIFWARWVMYVVALAVYINAQRYYPKPSSISYGAIKYILIPSFIGMAFNIGVMYIRNVFWLPLAITPLVSNLEWLVVGLFSLWHRYCWWLVALGWGTLYTSTDIPGQTTAKGFTVAQALVFLIQSPWVYDFAQLRMLVEFHHRELIAGHSFYDFTRFLDYFLASIATFLFAKSYWDTRNQVVVPKVDAGAQVSFSMSVVLVVLAMFQTVFGILNYLGILSVSQAYLQVITERSNGYTMFQILRFFEDFPTFLELLVIYVLWVRPNRGLLATKAMA